MDQPVWTLDKMKSALEIGDEEDIGEQPSSEANSLACFWAELSMNLKRDCSPDNSMMGHCTKYSVILK